MTFYPASINSILTEVRTGELLIDSSSRSVASDLICGSFVRLVLKVDPETDVITELRFRSNACGFGIAAAETLCRQLSGKHLSELGGLREEHLSELLRSCLVDAGSRSHCEATVIEAVRGLFAGYRERRLSSFNGDDSLICTCFGVSESTIDDAIKRRGLRSVEEVSEHCRAGLGCGSCRMLIQEMIDGSGQP